jgi:hypothetical protein
MSFGFEQVFEPLDAAGVFGVELAVVFEGSPVGSERFGAGGGSFVGRMGGDPGEDAGGDRTADRRPVLLCDPFSDFIDYDQFPRAALCA